MKKVHGQSFRSSKARHSKDPPPLKVSKTFSTMNIIVFLYLGSFCHQHHGGLQKLPHLQNREWVFFIVWKSVHRAWGRTSGEAFLACKDEELSSDLHKKLGITTHVPVTPGTMTGTDQGGLPATGLVLHSLRDPFRWTGGERGRAGCSVSSSGLYTHAHRWICPKYTHRCMKFVQY